jgi:hypothetical protein
MPVMVDPHDAEGPAGAPSRQLLEDAAYAAESSFIQCFQVTNLQLGPVRAGTFMVYRQVAATARKTAGPICIK